jgi:hypothetical protein
MRKPNLFIVGAPKCGTTALYRYLSRHPDVFMSPDKEPYYFATDFQEKARKNNADFAHCLTIESYLALFNGWTTQKYAGEGSVHYWTSQAAASAIATFNPDARIIIMVREPIDLLQSFHAEECFNTVETEKDFATALSLEDERRQGRKLPAATALNEILYYSDFVRFADNIGRYHTAFPSGQVRIILFDDFKKDAAGEFRALCAWLGIDPNAVTTFERVNANKIQRFRLVSALRGNPFILRMSRAFLPLSMRNALLRLHKRVNEKYVPRTPLDQSLRRELQRKYRHEVEKLGAILGRDLISLWGYDMGDDPSAATTRHQ